VHHRVKDFNTELKVFEQVTVACAYLREDNAFQEIDRVFEMVKSLRLKLNSSNNNIFSGPGYIEIPYDLVDLPLPMVTPTKYQLPSYPNETCDTEKIHEALAEITNRMQTATNPVVILGLEVHRLGTQKIL
jgi:TPP-dependent 2-oxoacid decarboxylase